MVVRMKFNPGSCSVGKGYICGLRSVLGTKVYRGCLRCCFYECFLLLAFPALLL
ncbi:MAG: hypothetical protein AVDCRST_MAG95-2624 [uncultured Adhaeribacter sp.]|uniref:Uncharacterized protein n=1 Tax=uncultured Adhaeribacter sp. TaxID=448109 RepID=A0A6J4J4Z7_9BACT|nr:MAG: hypothetical protein AVDCRST_MAG95-2624 [uncultured Adhaeribacter sp.]